MYLIAIARTDKFCFHSFLPPSLPPSRASLVDQLVKNLPAMWRPGFDPWVGKFPWRRERLPIPVFWPGEFHGLYSPWVAKSQTCLSDFHFTPSVPDFLWLLPLVSPFRLELLPCLSRVTVEMGNVVDWPPGLETTPIISASGCPLNELLNTQV